MRLNASSVYFELAFNSNNNTIIQLKYQLKL